MKKGKIVTKGQIAVFLMVAALGAAVWLNVKYSGGEKYLGQATYVDNRTKTSDAAKTSAKVKETDEDYFTTAKKEREAAFSEAQEAVEETLKSSTLTESEKEEAKESIKKLSNRIASAQNIESLLKAKGFKQAVAVIGDDNISIVVSSDGLTTQQTVQIQDIVTAQTDVSLSKIKIVTVK